MKNYIKNNNSKYFLIPIIILVGLFISFVGYSAYENCFQTSESAYVEGKLLSVNPKVPGFVVHVYVNDNQEVSKGDLLAEIDSSDYEIQLRKAEKELRDAKTQLNFIKREFNNISQDTDQTLNPFSKNSFHGYEKMYGEGIVSPPKQEKTQTTNPQKPKSEGEEEEINPEELAERVKQLEAEVEQAKLNLSYTKIFAPQDGTIHIRDLREGDYVEIGQNILSIIPKRVWVTANFSKEQAANMAVGQAVKVRIKMYPTKNFKGVIDNIQHFDENSKKVPVRIMFTEDYSEYNIQPNTSVTAIVKVK